jgi:hypothetical protein
MEAQMPLRLDAGQIEVVDEAIAAVLRMKTPAERIALAGQAQRTAREIMAAGLRSQYPDWSDEQIRVEVARRFARGAK